MSMNRNDHLEWCKRRARVYLEDGQVAMAMTSMVSDLSKHEETTLDTSLGQELVLRSLKIAAEHDAEAARNFIEGFK